MELKARWTARGALVATGMIAVVCWAGCSSKPAADSELAALAQEKERLLAENQEIAQVRAENEDVKRLKKENQELPKLRSLYQEASRFRKENDHLRQQVTKLAPAGGAPSTSAAGAGGGSPGAGPAAGEEKPKEVAAEGSPIHEGDEILIDPKQLKTLLPDFDWEKLGRKEALAVRALLEKDGIQITNTAQLKEYGLTNFTIQRVGPKPAETPPN